ncbi:MAG: hypothetical protein ABWJ42_02550 [Sulfolobales archaeon]
MKSRISVGEELLRVLAIIVIKRTVGFKTDLRKDSIVIPDTIRDEIDSIIESVSEIIVMRSGGLAYCRLCGRGSFTKRGLYLHLRRVHLEDIMRLLNEEINNRFNR